MRQTPPASLRSAPSPEAREGASSFSPARRAQCTWTPRRLLNFTPMLIPDKARLLRQIHFARRQVGEGVTPGRCGPGRKAHFRQHALGMIEGVQRQADVWPVDAAPGERRAAGSAEAALDHIGAFENVGRLRPVHLVGAEAHEGHERLARGLLAHAAEADARPVAWRIARKAPRAAWAAAGLGRSKGREGPNSIPAANLFCCMRGSERDYLADAHVHTVFARQL